MIRVLLDANIYDKIRDDDATRDRLTRAVVSGRLVVIATPVIERELSDSPFGGVPEFFPVRCEPEALFVLGHAALGMARLGSGEVFEAHRGESNKTRDAIIAESADKLADLFVSEDGRCRKRLAKIGTRCQSMNFNEFRMWLAADEDQQAV